jgi:hypothetical protein
VCAALAFVAALTANAQILKPVDPTKQADVNGKFVNPANLNLKEVEQPTRSFPRSPRSDERQMLPQVELKTIDPQQIQLSGYATRTVPLQNFTAKRAAISEKPRNEKDVKRTKAPIKDREIHAYTPGGEEELKKQLNEPH